MNNGVLSAFERSDPNLPAPAFVAPTLRACPELGGGSARAGCKPALNCVFFATHRSSLEAAGKLSWGQKWLSACVLINIQG